MPFSVLTANQVAERCYLHEALYWVAVSRFPLAYLTETGDESREYDKWLEGISPPYPLDLVSKEESLFAGLPVNPAWDAEQTFTHFSRPEELERQLAGASDGVHKKSLQSSLEESVAFYKSLEKWNLRFEAYLDLHKARLFVALRQGEVLATGKPVANSILSRLLKQTVEDKSSRQRFAYHEFAQSKSKKQRVGAPNWYSTYWEPIPIESWISEKISWEYCCAGGEAKGYAFVLVETAGLFKAFPIPKARNTIQVSQIGNGYVLFDNEGNTVSPPVASKGRPPFDWEEFHVEMAKRARDGKLPAKQEALIIEMQSWCSARWGREVGRSTLLQKIKPYYDALMRPSES